MRQSFCSRKGACCAAAFAVFMTAQAAMAQGGPIVISQLFGGGGQTAVGPNGDFIELFNRSCVPVNLDGYSVQVASGGTGTVWSVVPLPNFQLDPGKYYCIRLTTAATGVPFTHDLLQVGLPAGGDLMLSTSGKAAIVLGDTPLASAACPAAGTTVDFVKYEGTSSACTEGGSVGAALSGTGRCPSRRPDANGDGVGDGCQDTNNNSADFLVASTPCFPRNNASPANNCPGAAVFGGCELGDGSCRVVTGAAACSALGGNYLGNCTPCVAPQACCLPTTPVTCVVQSAVECQNQGGLFNPGQFSCPPAGGCPALGRCCMPDGNCFLTFGALCVSPNSYGGDGTNCSQAENCQGRCCAPDGTCTMTGQANCTAPNSFSGVGTTCQNQRVYGNPDPPTVIIPTTGTGPGASVPSIISVPDNFPIQDVDVRIKISHTWRNDILMCLSGPDGTTVLLTAGTSCTTGGACGSEDNYNIVYNDEGLPIVCASANLANLAATPDQVVPAQSLSAFDGLPSSGAWTLNIFDDAGGDSGTLLEWALLLDDGNACQGACCFSNGSCLIRSQLACQQQGGNYQGAGVGCSPSPCAPNGACCIGGLCSLRSNVDCLAANGVFGGNGSDCNNPPCFVPCCKQDGTCTLLTAAACAALPFSSPGAPGTPCPPAPCAPIGSCCRQDGICESPLVQAACTSPDIWVVNGSCQLSYVANTDCAPNFTDISQTGAELSGFAGLDDAAVTVPLPFNFRFYGVEYSSASVGINGYLVFAGGSAAGIPGNSPLNGAGFVNNSIYVYGDDLHLRSTAEGKIFVEQLGTSPDSLFIIQWTNVDLFSPSQPNGQRNTFQVKLYEASGVIEMQYLSLNLTGQTPLPADVVIGTRETATNVTEVSQSFVGVGPAAIIFAPTGGCTALTSPTGSCCIPNQPCSVQSQAQCQLNCGTYLGDNTNCTTAPCLNRACCLPQGGCVDAVPAACTALNGVPQGAGSNCGTANCPPAGKCCTAEGLCSIKLQANCQDAGSTWELGGDCSSPCIAGACCGPEGVCSQTAIGACVAPNVFRGPGTNCNQPGLCEGRCCLANGNCSVETISSCANAGGTFTIGLDCSAVTIVTFDNVGLVIPDSPAPAVSDIRTVTGLPTPITDLDVDVFVRHTYVGDLVIDVEHDGVVVSLLNGTPVGAGCFAGDDPNIVLDDEGTGGPIMAAPCQGTLAPQSPPSYTPVGTLAAFDGMDPNGDWTIRIRDDVGADTGTLIRWSLHVATNAPVCGSGGGCNCRGDVNGDGSVNGKDVKSFAQCVASGGAGCPCADMNNSGSANSADVPAFVTAVLTGNCGP